jgi:tryptophan synthase alpha chain
VREEDGPTRIRGAFGRARADGRAALVCYLPAGYPDLATSARCLLAAGEAGADLLEIGFPFSDPVMDGPTIAAAAQTALERGATVDGDLRVCRDVTAAASVPALVMTYYTIPSVRGLHRFAREAVEAGLSGAILPDLPSDEAEEWCAAAAGEGLATVFLAAPTSTDARLDALTEVTTGFVYATSVLGVTGIRDSVADARDLVDRIRTRTDLPVAVGIGVSDAEQAADVASYADGVIVGSALVRAIGRGEVASAPDRVAELVAELRRGIESASSKEGV